MRPKNMVVTQRGDLICVVFETASQMVSVEVPALQMYRWAEAIRLRARGALSTEALLALTDEAISRLKEFDIE